MSLLPSWSPDARYVQAIEVTHSVPAYRAEYERIFRVPVRFESEKNAVLFSPEFWASAPPAMTSRYACGVMSAHADSLLETLESEKTMRGRVESLLVDRLHTGEARIDFVAGKLGVSRSTLFRKLKAEGTTFEKSPR